MEENRKIKVVMLEPYKTARITELDASLNGMQRAVDGYIQAIYPFKDTSAVCLVCNEEGKLNNMPPNRAIYGEDNKIIDVICGPAFICDCSGENFGSLSKEQAERYKKQFKYPEMFVRTNDGIKAIPLKTGNDLER